jgi:hypothetical protein
MIRLLERIVEESLRCLLVGNPLYGLRRGPTNDVSEDASINRVVLEREKPVNANPVFRYRVLRVGVYPWGIGLLTIPMLKDFPNNHDTTSIDIHETNVTGVESVELWSIFFARDKGALLLDPNLMGAFAPKIFGFSVDVVIVHSWGYHLFHRLVGA